MQLQRVYYKSDLKIRVVFRDWQEKPLPRFAFRYSTGPGDTSYTASYDGENYVNCTPCDEGVMICRDYPHFLPGRLRVERYFPCDDERFDDQEFSFAKECLTGIEITDVDDFDIPVSGEATEYAEKEPGEKGDKGDPGEKGEKGDKGDKGDPGASGGAIDYSLLVEQEVPGEFWLGFDGATRKQVYVRTFTGTTLPGFYTDDQFDPYYPYYQMLGSSPAMENVSVVNAWIRLPEYRPGCDLGGENYQWDIVPSLSGLKLYFKKSPGALGNRRYSITVKYTKP